MTTPGQVEGIRFDPRIYLAILVFRWKIIVLCVLLCTLAAVVYLNLAPREYLTKTVVMIYRDPTLMVTDSGSQWSSIRMHMWLLNSEELHTTVIRKLQNEWEQKVGGFSRLKVPFTVELERGHGTLLVLSVRNTGKEYAAAYLTALWNEFMDRQDFRKGKVSGKVIEVLQEELGNMEGEIRQAQNELDDFTRLVSYDVTAASINMERQYLLTLLGYKNQLNTELLLIETEFPMLRDVGALVINDIESLNRDLRTRPPVSAEAKGERGGLPAAESGKAALRELGTSERHLVDEPEVKRLSDMKVELMRLQAQTNALLAKFTLEYPEVKAACKKIEDLREQQKISHEVAFGRLNEKRKALKILSEAIDVPIKDWNSNFRRASGNESEYQRKQLRIERVETLYRTLYSRLQDLKVSEELKSEHFVVVTPVKTQENPVWPVPRTVIVAAIVLALGTGIGLAVLAHVFDNKIQTIVDVENVLGFPFLGGVPKWTGSGTDKVARPIVLEEHAGGAVEAYRVLRTNVMSAMDKAGQKMALFTSAEAKEGKTITVLNLAVMMAKAGKKILLIDMDLRRPRLHRSLGCERSPGVADALLKGIPLRDVVLRTEVENLRFVPSGTEVDNVAELLQSVNLATFFGGIKEEYDYILIDTSPVLRAADVSILAGRGLCSIVYVARVNRTPKPLVRYALDQLSQGHILGIVMNHIDLNRISSLYYSYQYPNYAYYAYSYAYGYDYDHYADGVMSRRRKPGMFWASLRNFAREVRRALLPMG